MGKRLLVTQQFVEDVREILLGIPRSGSPPWEEDQVKVALHRRGYPIPGGRWDPLGQAIALVDGRQLNVFFRSSGWRTLWDALYPDNLLPEVWGGRTRKRKSPPLRKASDAVGVGGALAADHLGAMAEMEPEELAGGMANMVGEITVEGRVGAQVFELKPEVQGSPAKPSSVVGEGVLHLSPAVPGTKAEVIKEPEKSVCYLNWFGKKVRTVIRGAGPGSVGEAFFVMVDVAAAMEVDRNNAGASLDERYEQGGHRHIPPLPALLDTEGGLQSHRLITREDVIHLAVVCRSEKAHKFRAWLVEQGDNILAGRPTRLPRGDEDPTGQAAVLPAGSGVAVGGSTARATLQMFQALVEDQERLAAMVDQQAARQAHLEEGLQSLDGRLAEVLRKGVGRINKRFANLEDRVDMMHEALPDVPMGSGSLTGPQRDVRARGVLRTVLKQYVGQTFPGPWEDPHIVLIRELWAVAKSVAGVKKTQNFREDHVLVVLTFFKTRYQDGTVLWDRAVSSLGQLRGVG